MTDEDIKKLRRIVGEGHLRTDRETLLCYAYDATGREALPEAVLFPADAGEIAAVMQLASEAGFPVVPRGAGSGFAGGSVPLRGGVVLSLSRLNRIIEIDTENMQAVVEPGVITGHLQQAVEAKGLFYPPDPSSLKFCTLGGNVAMGAGGPRAVKYGVTRDYVMGLDLVLPTGEIIRTGTRTAKGVVGYDLTRLMVGSEGTLGIVTRIILRLIPKPEARETFYVEYGDPLDAGRAVSAVMASGVLPAMLEFIDRSTLSCIREHLKDPVSEGTGAILLVEADGRAAAVREEADRLQSILEGFNPLVLRRTADRKMAEGFWEARRAISPALFKLGTKKINEDIVVPRSKVPELLEKLSAISERFGLLLANFGHAGDGNIHVNIMIHKGKAEEERKAEEAVREVFRAALDLGGTISGEHGVGLSKQPYIAMELSEREMALMKGIKQVFDPKGILNPGKIFPEG